MAETTLLDALRSVRFLDGMADDDLQQLAGIATLMRVPAGKPIFAEGDSQDKFYIVADGSVMLSMNLGNGVAKHILTIGKGELLGWTPFVDKGNMKASARAQGEARVIAFDAGRALALCGEMPSLGCSLYRQTARALAERLLNTRRYLLEISHQMLPDVPPMGTQEGAD